MCNDVYCVCVFQIKADVLHRLTECREWMVSTPLKGEFVVASCFSGLFKSLIFVATDFDFFVKLSEVKKAAVFRSFKD